MPADSRGQDTGFVDEFLEIVLTEVEVGVWEAGDGRSVEGDDIGDGFVFGDGDDTDRFGAICFCGSGGDADVYLGEVLEEGGHSGGIRRRDDGGGSRDGRRIPSC